MDMITILGVNPEGGELDDYKVMEQFVNQINGFYRLFDMKAEFKPYDGKLEKTDKGLYTVRSLQSELIQCVKKSIMCFCVVYCGKEQSDEMAVRALLSNIGQQKKTECVLYFKIDDMNMIRNDISRRLAAKNEKLPIPRENRANMASAAAQILNQGVKFDQEGKLNFANAMFQQSLAIEKKLMLTEPDKYRPGTLLPLHNMAAIAFRTKNTKGAIALYEQTLQERDLVEKSVKKSKISMTDAEVKRNRVLRADECTNLGNLYLGNQQTDKASEVYDQAIKLRKQICMDDPNPVFRVALADAYGNKGILCNQINDPDEAQENFESMYEMLKAVLAENPSDDVKKKISICCNTLSIMYQKKKQNEKAIEIYEETIGYRQEMYEKDATSENRRILLDAYGNMGVLYNQEERPEDAVNSFISMYELLKLENEAAPEDDNIKRRICMCCGSLGSLYQRQKQTEKAVEVFNHIIEICKEFYEKDENSQNRLALSEAYGNMAVLNNQEGKPAEAAGYFVLMSELLKKETETNPSDEIKKKLGMCGNSLGIAYLQTNQPEKADEVFRSNYLLYEDLLSRDENAYEPPMALVCYHESQVLRNLKRGKESVPYLQRAIKICDKRKDDNPTCKRIYDSIIQENEKAKKTLTASAEQIVKQADELRNQAKYNEAAAAYRKAAGFYAGIGTVESQLKMAGLYDECGVMMWDYVQLDQAKQYFTNGIALYRAIAKADATHMPDLSVALFNYGRFIDETEDRSINEYFREAFEIAEKYKDVNEKALEIYENLEDDAEALKAYRTEEELGQEKGAPAVPEGGFEILEDSDAEDTAAEIMEEAVEAVVDEEDAEGTADTSDSGDAAGEKKGFFGKLFGKK